MNEKKLVDELMNLRGTLRVYSEFHERDFRVFDDKISALIGRIENETNEMLEKMSEIEKLKLHSA